MEVKPGYKMTEVGLIPEDWDTLPCSALCDLITVGIVVRPTQYYVNQGVPALRSGNVKESGITDSDLVFISEKVNQTLSKSQIREGDVLSVRTGYPGTSAVVPKRFDGSNCIDILITRPSKKINSRFLSAWINSPMGKYQVLRDQGGLAQQHFNVGDLRELLVAVPSRFEQNSIAEALFQMDSLVTNQEELLAKKHQIKQGAMQELLGPKEGWHRRKLGELAKIQRGASPRPIDSPIWFDNDSSVGWVRISDVTRSGMYLRETTQRLSPMGVESSRSVDRGSLIMSICATVGRPIITDIDACIHDGFVVFSNLQVEKHFLYYFLKSIENGWSKHGQSGSQMNLNTDLIMATTLEIPPSKEEQEQIAETFILMDSEISSLETKLAKARQIKQGMMQELLTGRIRLTQPA